MKPEALMSKSMLNVHHPSSGLWTQRRNDNMGKDAPWCEMQGVRDSRRRDVRGLIKHRWRWS